MTSEEIESGRSPDGTTPAHPSGSVSASDASDAAHTPASPAATRGGWLGFEEVAFIALVVLAIGGMAVADFSASSGLTYWLVVIPFFGAVSVYSGWRRARADGKRVGKVLLSQILHWGSLVLAVYLIYLLERTGRLNREDAGLVALLSLSLTTLLAGIHFDWRLAVLGILLAVGTACAALVEEFFWILLILSVVVGVVVVVWERRKS
jgi:hypothetical protein